MELAQAFTARSLGLRAGEVVFDGPPDQLTDTVLTSIYGEEDWSAMRRASEEDSAADEQGKAERMAGLV